MIDFQGAFLAPPEYDLVCLLRDSYVELPEAEVAHLLHRVRARLPDRPEAAVFQHRFDALTLTRKGKDHARFLYQEPSALLADEPVSSVDPARARATIDLLTRISREEGLTLCVSLHNLDLAREFLPRLIGLRGGRVIFDRPREEVADAEFHALYDLRPEEMLVDGA